MFQAILNKKLEEYDNNSEMYCSYLANSLKFLNE